MRYMSKPSIIEAIQWTGDNKDMAARAAEIAEFQKWTHSLRDQIDARAEQLGLGGRFLGEHFRGWAHHYGVYR